MQYLTHGLAIAALLRSSLAVPTAAHVEAPARVQARQDAPTAIVTPTLPPGGITWEAPKLSDFCPGEYEDHVCPPRTEGKSALAVEVNLKINDDSVVSSGFSELRFGSTEKTYKSVDGTTYGYSTPYWAKEAEFTT